MESPIFMGWTLIPVDLVVRAWTDTQFKREFLRWPTQTLQDTGVALPLEVNFCVVENTSDNHFLVLPHRPYHTYGWDRKQVEETLRKETGNDNTLEYWLPVNIMVEAFFNVDFKKRLLMDTNAALLEMGYDPGKQHFTVLENTDQTFHLILPENKWHSRSLSEDDLAELLVQELMAETVFH